MVKMRVALLMLLLMPTAFVAAQYGEIVDGAVSEAPLSLGTALRLVGTASGSLDPFATAETAAETLTAVGFRLPGDGLDDPINHGDYAFLLVQLRDLQTGLVDTLLPSRRGAFRELRARGLMRHGIGPGDPISGIEAVELLRDLRAGEAER